MTVQKSVRPFVALLAFIAVSQLAGIVGSIFTISAIPEWYAGLVRPAFAPPNWIFGPVWTTLFLLMGIAAFLVWRKGGNRPEVKTALSLFAFQLVLNTLWSVVFFGLESLAAGSVEIIALWVAIVATMVAFYRISRPAGWLLVPYLLWVSFATCLTFGFWVLN